MSAPMGLDPQEVIGFCAALEETENSGNGYGRLVSCVIESDLTESVRAVGRYEDGRWAVTFEERS